MLLAFSLALLCALLLRDKELLEVSCLVHSKGEFSHITKGFQLDVYNTQPFWGPF